MDPDKKDPAAIADTRMRIERIAPGLHAMSTRDHVNSLTEIQLAKGMAWLTSAIALLIGTFGMMNTMVMSIHERTKEIGTLRAVGWRKGRVIRMILLEAFLLSVIGALAGTVGSLVLLRILTRVPVVNGLIDGRLDPLLILEGLLIAVAVGVVGGALPRAAPPGCCRSSRCGMNSGPIYSTLSLRRSLRMFCSMTSGNLARSTLAPPNQPSGSVKATCSSKKSAPAGAARRLTRA